MQNSRNGEIAENFYNLIIMRILQIHFTNLGFISFRKKRERYIFAKIDSNGWCTDRIVIRTRKIHEKNSFAEVSTNLGRYKSEIFFLLNYQNNSSWSIKICCSIHYTWISNIIISNLFKIFTVKFNSKKSDSTRQFLRVRFCSLSN